MGWRLHRAAACWWWRSGRSTAWVGGSGCPRPRTPSTSCRCRSTESAPPAPPWTRCDPRPGRQSRRRRCPPRRLSSRPSGPSLHRRWWRRHHPNVQPRRGAAVGVGGSGPAAVGPKRVPTHRGEPLPSMYSSRTTSRTHAGGSGRRPTAGVAVRTVGLAHRPARWFSNGAGDHERVGHRARTGVGAGPSAAWVLRWRGALRLRPAQVGAWWARAQVLAAHVGWADSRRPRCPLRHPRCRHRRHRRHGRPGRVWSAWSDGTRPRARCAGCRRTVASPPGLHEPFGGRAAHVGPPPPPPPPPPPSHLNGLIEVGAHRRGRPHTLLVEQAAQQPAVQLVRGHELCRWRAPLLVLEKALIAPQQKQPPLQLGLARGHHRLLHASRPHKL
jgi:hypothetical protein